MHVKPAEGMKLLDPETGAPIPPEGIEVSDYDLYWTRRLRDGDAVKVEAQRTPTPRQERAAKEA